MANRIVIVGRSGAGKVTIARSESNTIAGYNSLVLARAGEVVALIEEGSYATYPSLVTLQTIAPDLGSWEADANSNDQALGAWINQNFSRATRAEKTADYTLGAGDQFVLFTGGSEQIATLPDIGGSSQWRVLWHYGKSLPLKLDVAPAALSGTAEETIKSVVIPGGWTDRDGKGFRVRAIVKTDNTGNNKTARLTFGATELITSGAIALNNGYIYLEASVWRKGATSQLSEGKAWASNLGLLPFTPQFALPAETLANDVTLALKLTCPMASTDATPELFEVMPIDVF